MSYCFIDSYVPSKAVREALLSEREFSSHGTMLLEHFTLRSIVVHRSTGERDIQRHTAKEHHYPAWKMEQHGATVLLGRRENNAP